MNAQNLQSSVESAGQLELPVEDRDHQISADGDPYPPVPIFVGFGECRFGNLFGEAKVIESFGSGIDAGGDVAKSIPRCHLGKDHADELLPALEMPNTLLCSISGDEPGECLAFDEFDNLGESIATGVHRRGAWKMPLRSSNA